jgi:hypothetical protein
MSLPEAYIYQPLGPRYIRLIKIVRPNLWQRVCGTSEPDQPELQLEDVSLDETPQYEAISYTWDGQQCEHPIICNGRALKTTKNCIRVLQRLKARACGRFWIDALCIDQSSTNSKEEKTYQIPLMGEIYRKASRVLIWLGESTEGSRQTFQYLNDISDILKSHQLQLSKECMDQVEVRRRQFGGTSPSSLDIYICLMYSIRCQCQTD